MELYYTKVDFYLETEHKLNLSFPWITIRSILGKELRKLACINPAIKDCETCIYNASCVYANFFETILPKENDVVPGRIRGAHPYSIIPISHTDRQFAFSIVVFGNNNQYLSYIATALMNGQKPGIGKNRIPYKVTEITCNNTDILNIEDLSNNSFQNLYVLNEDCEKSEEVNYHITLCTPLKIVQQGKQLSEFDSQIFFKTINRRIRQLISMYGTENEEKPYTFGESQIVNSLFTVIKLDKWSSKQNQVEKLGGLTGSFELTGNLSPFEKSLLQAGVLFSIGKNTTHGLGKIEVKSIK